VRGLGCNALAYSIHATIQRWVYKFTPLIEKTFRKRKKAVGNSWRMDETYIKVKGEWMYLYRAVDKEGIRSIFYSPKEETNLPPISFW
jgi:putative transposase